MNTGAEIIETTDTNKKKVSLLEDVGEKIGGAKKDIYKRLEAINEADLASQPFSKSFPEPDYAKLVADGVITQDGAIFIKFAYDNIPTKPRKTYALARWVRTTTSAINSIKDVIEGGTKDADFEKYVAISGIVSSTFKDQYQMFSSIMKGLGFPVNAVKLGKFNILKFNLINYSVFRGKELTFEDKKKITYTLVEGSNIIKDYDTLEGAIDGLKEALDKGKGKAKTKETRFDVFQSRATKEFFIGKKGANDVVHIMDGFATAKDAFEFVKTQRAELQAIWNGMKLNPEERRDENRPRVGIDWRNGKNITSEEFATTFGFRGVEFGNWVNSAERQSHVNDAYDSLMDLSGVIGFDKRAISLNGELGFAFGARGSGRANAHYEPDKVVINLTKTKGAGSLAHEWWHGIDSYFSRVRGLKSGFITESPRQRRTLTGEWDSSIRIEVLNAFKGITEAIEKTELRKRSMYLDKTRSQPYWSTMIELTARCFENYVISKLGETNQTNDYLANFKETSEWLNDTKGNIDVSVNYPYPLATETPSINEAYEQFFSTIQQNIVGEKVSLFETGGEITNTNMESKFELGTPAIYKETIWNGEVQENAGEIVMRDGKKGILLYPNENYGGRSRKFIEPDWSKVFKFNQMETGGLLNSLNEGEESFNKKMAEREAFENFIQPSFKEKFNTDYRPEYAGMYSGERKDFVEAKRHDFENLKTNTMKFNLSTALLGNKMIDNGTKVRDEVAGINYEIADIGSNGFVLMESKVIDPNRSSHSVSFDDFEDKFRTGQISIEGYNNQNPEHGIILHTVVRHIKTQFELGGKIESLHKAEADRINKEKTRKRVASAMAMELDEMGGGGAISKEAQNHLQGEWDKMQDFLSDKFELRFNKHADVTRIENGKEEKDFFKKHEGIFASSYEKQGDKIIAIAHHDKNLSYIVPADAVDIEKFAKGGLLTPHKEVSASVQASIKDVLTLDKYKSLKPMEASMFYNKFKDYEKLKFDTEGTEYDNYIAPYETDGLTGKIFEKLEKNGYVRNEEWNSVAEISAKGIEFVNAVRGRIETRKGFKAGSDLFESNANIPEYTPPIAKKHKRDVKRDKGIKAKKEGKRISKNGNVYYESRPTHSDKDLRKKL